MAGTTVFTPSSKKNFGGVVTTYKWAAVADASDGSVLSKATPEEIHGFILGFETNPGATAPTANYGVTLTNANGCDVLGGAGAGRSAAVTESGMCLQGAAYNPARRVDSVLTFAAASNSVNSAIIDFEISVLLD